MLKPLLLLEAIIVLAICLVIAIAIIIRQKNNIKKLRDKFQELTQNSGLLTTTLMENFFKQSIADCIARYEKLTNSSTIVFDAHRPYTEKVAALRYIYLNLEKDAEEIKKTNKISWIFFEERMEVLLGLLKHTGEDQDIRQLKVQLQEYKAESQLTINKLKEIITNLQQSLQTSVTQLPEKIYKETVESIISNDNLIKIRDLFEEIRNFSDDFPRPHSLEKSINTLEYEVETTDRFFTKIKNNEDYGDVNLDEVNKLKESNKVQRTTINHLEKEIQILRDSIDVNETQEVKDNKENEISRLERMVKEYEGCVVILEGQIDDLYSRLEEASHQPIIEVTPGIIREPENDLKAINAELENVSKRMNSLANDYRLAVSLNRSIYNFSQCKTIKEIASTIVKLLKEFDISAGFTIQSSTGKADYFPSLLFNDTLKKLVKNSMQKEHIGQLNGHSFFVAPRIKMIVMSSEEAADTINSTISGLVYVASENVQRLEHLYLQKKNIANIDVWTSLAKNKIANIDIQFSYQAEESRKIFNDFIINLKNAYSQLELKGEGAIILDNAINEYEARMHLLLSGGDVIDRELSKLLNHIGVLKVQNTLHNE